MDQLFQISKNQLSLTLNKYSRNTVPAVFILAKLALDVVDTFCEFVLADEGNDVGDAKTA